MKAFDDVIALLTRQAVALEALLAELRAIKPYLASLADPKE